MAYLPGLTVRTLRLADAALAELMLLCGFDYELAAQITQVSNRLRGLLTARTDSRNSMASALRLWVICDTSIIAVGLNVDLQLLKRGKFYHFIVSKFNDILRLGHDPDIRAPGNLDDGFSEFQACTVTKCGQKHKIIL